MFDTLADRFDGIFHKLRSRGKLTDKEIDEVCRELRVALLEADVNVLVARNFIRRVKERAQGSEVAKSLSPAQQVIKIVNEELIETLGGTTGKLTSSSKPWPVKKPGTSPPSSTMRWAWPASCSPRSTATRVAEPRCR